MEYVLKAKKVLGNWPTLEDGNWTQRWRELFPPKVMLGAGCKHGVSCSRELRSRYDYLGVSCSLRCDAKENIKGDWTQDMSILVGAIAPQRTVSRLELLC